MTNVVFPTCLAPIKIIALPVLSLARILLSKIRSIISNIFNRKNTIKMEKIHEKLNIFEILPALHFFIIIKKAGCAVIWRILLVLLSHQLIQSVHLCVLFIFQTLTINIIR